MPIYVLQRSGDAFLHEPGFTQKGIDNASDLCRFRNVHAQPGDFVTVWPADTNGVARIAEDAGTEDEPNGDGYYSEAVTLGAEAWVLYQRHCERMEDAGEGLTGVSATARPCP